MIRGEHGNHPALFLLSDIRSVGGIGTSSGEGAGWDGERARYIVEGDVKACFDEISHSALMDRVWDRVGDKRVLPW